MISAEAAGVLAYFDVKGYSFASDILGAYLGNNREGYEYRISSRNVEQVVACQVVKDATEANLLSIKEEAKNNSAAVGVRQELTSNWKVVNVTDNSDVTLALGNFSVAVGSDTTILSNEGGTVKADIWYRVYVYDLYDWDKTTEWSWDLERTLKTGLNNDMRQLEEAGWARSFKARGESAMSFYWTGIL
ncbi:hypothetical protein ACFWUP_23670 [Nocardia sp. NPDC058658]|uniref:hypothetical protein n=1 Tax=Nocardia sp. NPDC058658 TaxID=3346580 RepID=UPI003653318D